MNDCVCFRTYKCLSCEAGEARKIAIAEGRALSRKIAKCGTRAGYNRHLKLKEPTCVDCREAHTEAVLRFRRKKAMN